MQPVGWALPTAWHFARCTGERVFQPRRRTTQDRATQAWTMPLAAVATRRNHARAYSLGMARDTYCVQHPRCRFAGTHRLHLILAQRNPARDAPPEAEQAIEMSETSQPPDRPY